MESEKKSEVVETDETTHLQRQIQDLKSQFGSLSDRMDTFEWNLERIATYINSQNNVNQSFSDSILINQHRISAIRESVEVLELRMNQKIGGENELTMGNQLQNSRQLDEKTRP